MSTDAEMIADRRRLRRKLSVWRVMAVLALVVAVAAIGFRVAGRDPSGLVEGPRHVARISISGFISGDRHMTEVFERVGKSDSTAGVIIAINSPGGTTTGAEELYRGIRALAEKKPTVAFVDGLAASGGYIAALAADRIVARETSLVGSIGVLFQIPNVSDLLGNVGVSVEEIKSSPLKAAPSGVTPTSPEARAALQSVVNDTYAWFRGLVGGRRQLGEAEVAIVSDGRIFSGRQALPLRLVDQLGGEDDALAWLETQRGVTRDLPVRDWKPRKDRDGFGLLTTAAFGADLLGFEHLAASVRRFAGSAQAIQLDGLLAVWQPVAEK
jgi:protease-4